MVEFNDEGVQRLGYAVVIQAVKDYRMAVRTRNKYRRIECEMFFQSDWFNAFSRLDGKVLLERLQKEVRWR